MITQIVTAKGQVLIINFGKKTVKIVGQSISYNNLKGRAYIASMAHHALSCWPATGTHYIQADNVTIVLTAHQAKKYNSAYKEYYFSLTKFQKNALEECLPGLAQLQQLKKKKAKTAYKKLEQQYPLAALYLRADSYSDSTIIQRSIAGEDAKALLEDKGSLKEAKEILDNWENH